MNQAPAVTRDADPEANQLVGLVYAELRQLAARKMSRELPGQTLEATALVHEAWLRLGGDKQPAWKNRAEFFAAAAEAMRRILIEKARRKKSLRRGGQFVRIDLGTLDLAAETDAEEILALNEALDRFSSVDPRKAELVKLRFFVGLTLEQAAEALGISEATAKRNWAYARAWLYRELSAE